MPALLLSDKSASILKQVIEKNGENSELQDMRDQMNVPLLPEQKGAIYPKGTVIDHRCLIQVTKWASANQSEFNEDLTLTKLLKGAQLAIGVKPKPVRSPELIETLRKIQLIKEQEEYDRMMSSSLNQGKRSIFQTSKERENPWQITQNRSEAEEWEQIRKQIGAIINVALSVAAVATATWWAGGNADPIWKTLVAMPLCLLVAIAEIALYARHWDNVQKRKAAR